MTLIRRIAGCAALIGVAACGRTSSQDAAADEVVADSSAVAHPAVQVDRAAAPDSALTAAGWRGLRIGMTRAEVVAAAGEDAHPEAVGGPDPASCDEFRPTSAPEGLLVMIRSGRLSRIAISEGTGIATGAGIEVGDPASAVVEAHGADVVSTPHVYHPAPARYLAVWQVQPPAPAARGIVYEIDGSERVMRILAGDESVEYPEGCV